MMNNAEQIVLSISIPEPNQIREMPTRGNGGVTNDSTSKNSNKILMQTIGLPKQFQKLWINKIIAFARNWKMVIIMLACVIALSLESLFLFIPTINNELKCLGVDNKLKVVAFVSRSVVDFCCILHLIFQFCKIHRANRPVKLKESGPIEYFSSNIGWYFNILMDVLVLLPITQLTVLVTLYQTAGGSGDLIRKEFLSFFFLFNYGPWIFRIYKCCDEIKKTHACSFTGWVKGAFNLWLYIIASHIIGALWYFFAILRAISCWTNACNSHIDCAPSNFVCGDNFSNNSTYLTEFCHKNPSNSMIFNYGIFYDALESGILWSKDFPSKYLQCFWWGLRNLSSFGSNLNTSAYFWENCFAAITSIIGLLLFSYLIGNVQSYMRSADKESKQRRKSEKKLNLDKPDFQLARSNNLDGADNVKTVTIVPSLNSSGKQDESSTFYDQEMVFIKPGEIIRSRKRAQHRNKTEQNTEIWMLKNRIPKHMMAMIIQYLRDKFSDDNSNNQDIDVTSLLYILPIELKKSVKKHLCLPILRQVPMLLTVDEQGLEKICDYLKPVIYPENSYIIRAGEPLDIMLFITEGVALTFGGESEMVKCLGKCSFYGDRLLKNWEYFEAPDCFSGIQISREHVKSHKKVEAFALMAVDWKHIVSRYLWHKFPRTIVAEEKLKSFAASVIQTTWRHHHYADKTSPGINAHPLI